jgi:hypothetical protein
MAGQHERQSAHVHGAADQGEYQENNQPVSSRLWSSGFLSSEYAGVGLRSSGDPVLYLTDPNGVDREVRRKMLDAVKPDQPADV